jgi:transposase-like protein
MYARQEKFLNLRAMGYTVLEACAEVGINRKTYEKWRQRLEYFKIASDEIRVAKQQPLREQYVATTSQVSASATSSTRARRSI